MMIGSPVPFVPACDGPYLTELGPVELASGSPLLCACSLFSAHSKFANSLMFQTNGRFATAFKVGKTIALNIDMNFRQKLELYESIILIFTEL